MNHFHHALDALRRQAQRDIRNSTIGRIYSEVDKMRRRGTAGALELDRLSRSLRRLRSNSVLQQEMRGTNLGRFIGEVDKYARKGMREALLESVLDALGPVGGLIGTFLRPQGKPLANVSRELEMAADLLKAFGYRVEAPKTPQQAARNIASEVQRSKRLLESLGFKVEPPPAEKAQQPPPGQGTEYVSMAGLRKRVKPDDPLLTGAWIPVTSSNVESIGYIWNEANPAKGTLKVRFLDKRKGATSARGSVYHYYDVHPSLFDNFRRAASKGRWVWDNLRIRGTVSGHQFRYALAGLASDGYVPRQATRLGPKEYYLQRQVRSKSGQEYQSELQDEFVRYWEPKRGTPNRGKGRGPNRGAPNRGR